MGQRLLEQELWVAYSCMNKARTSLSLAGLDAEAEGALAAQ